MAHFAKLDENNIVTAVIVVHNNVITVDDVESEKAGVDFCKELTGHDLWKQTSFNRNFRKNFAGIGYTYDSDFDAFVAPRPYASWKLNYETFEWEPPTPYPVEDEGFYWRWSELNKEWVKLDGSRFTGE